LCDLISDNEKRLKIDKEKYGVSDTVINRLRSELIKRKIHIQSEWNEENEDLFVSQCKKEYIVEVNS
jgi:hypothetical protein